MKTGSSPNKDEADCPSFDASDEPDYQPQVDVKLLREMGKWPCSRMPSWNPKKE